MKKSKSRGVGLVEVLLGSAILAAGVVGLITFTTKSIKTKQIVEAKEDVQGITEVMKTSLSALPSTPEEYKQVLGSKWVKITDPWGNHYRMIVADNLSSDLCKLGATSLSAQLPDGQVVKNVLYLTWTRPERMVETGQVPSSGEASLSEFGTTYARYSGNVKLTRDAIYDIYTLDMYKAENCSVAGGSPPESPAAPAPGVPAAPGKPGGEDDVFVPTVYLYTKCYYRGEVCILYERRAQWVDYWEYRVYYEPVAMLYHYGPIYVGRTNMILRVPWYRFDIYRFYTHHGYKIRLTPLPDAEKGVVATIDSYCDPSYAYYKSENESFYICVLTTIEYWYGYDG